MYLHTGTRNLCCCAAGEKHRQLFCAINSQQVNRGLTNAHQTKYRDLHGEIDTTIDYVNAARRRNEISSICPYIQHKYRTDEAINFARRKDPIIVFAEIYYLPFFPLYSELVMFNVFQKHKNRSDERWTTTLIEGLYLREPFLREA